MEADEEIPSADHTYGSLTRLSVAVALLFVNAAEHFPHYPHYMEFFIRISYIIHYNVFAKYIRNLTGLLKC